MNAIIKVEQLSKVIKGRTILNDINFEVRNPGVYGIIGRNGSGKSMFFKCLAGLYTPTKGNISLNGVDIGRGNFPEHFGALLDTPGFVPHYSGFNNLKLLASIQKLVTEEEIKKVIVFVGLDPEDSQPVKKYSLGMKQRLGIAQAIMEKPDLLILDEPMNGLDESGVKDMRKMILDFKNQGMTILLASHNSEDIAILCDKVYKIDSGRLSIHNTGKEQAPVL